MSDIRLIECRPTEEDGKRVFAWRTDPETQAQFFTKMDLDWDGFWPVWRDGYFSDPDLTPAFAVDGDGEPVGIVSFARIESFDGYGACVDISINIAPGARGQGVGVQALKQVPKYLAGRGVDTVAAVVKVDNPASAAIFEKAGFRYSQDDVHRVERTGEDVAVKRYILELG